MSDNPISIDSLTESNCKQLLDVIELIQQEYAFANGGVVRLSFDNHKEADEFLKFHNLLVGFSVSNELDMLKDYKFNESSSVSLYVSISIEKLLELRNSLTIRITSATTPFNSRRLAKLRLNSATKTIRITVGDKAKNVHKFRSKLDANYIIFKNLTLYPNRAMTKKDLGVPKMLSPLKDIPKTMGFVGELKSIFFTIDTKNQTLTLHPEKTLTDDETETLNQYVNS